MKQGDLYFCEKYFLMLHPHREACGHAEVAQAASSTTSRTPPAVAVSDRGTATWLANYWTIKFGKPVGYLEKNTPFLILNRQGNYVEVFAGDHKGWIIFRKWLGVEEIR